VTTSTRRSAGPRIGTIAVAAFWIVCLSSPAIGQELLEDPPASPFELPTPSAMLKVTALTGQDAFHPGREFRAALVVEVPPHHYIGAHEPPPDESYVYLPTALKFDALPAGVRIDRQVFPLPVEKSQRAGDTVVRTLALLGRFSIGIQGHIAADVEPGTVEIVGELDYQICDAVKNTCLLPPAEPVTIRLRIVSPDQPVQAQHADVLDAIDWSAPATATASQPGGGTTAAQEELRETIDRGLPAFLLYAALFGLVSLLTPCVFPMIPITVSYFTKQGEKQGSKPIFLAAVYCLSIVLVFTLLGVLLAVFRGAGGANELAQDPIMNLVMGVVFVLFAVMLFGLWEVRMPTKLVDFTSRRGQGGGLLGVVFMALTFTLVSFTCTTPFIGSVLVLGANSGNWFYPVIGMATYAAAFAAPFFFLAAFPGLLAKLPKSGGWLTTVKVVMGFLELAFSIKFLSNTDLVWGIGILTHDVVLVLWALTSAAIAVYLLGLFRFPSEPKPTRIGAVRWAMAVAWLAVGVYLGAGLFRPLNKWVEAYLPPLKTHWETDYQIALAEARKTGKPLFLDFTGVTCTNCRLMEQYVFEDPGVKRLHQDFVLVRLFTDRGANAKQYAEMQKQRYGTVELPLYVVLTSQERYVGKFGYDLNIERFIERLKKDRQQARAEPAPPTPDSR